MKQIELGTVNATFSWMLREHHGWTKLHSANVSNRAEWDKECAEVVMDAANDSSEQPSMFSRADFLDCDYYGSQFASLKPETTHIVAKSADNIEQFTDEATAQTALDEAMNEHGLNRLYCDRGGHAGETERVDVTDIDITIKAGNDRLRFTAPDLGAEFTADDILEKTEDLTDAEVAAVVNIANAALQSFQE